jgi:hypothetical protein
MKGVKREFGSITIAQEMEMRVTGPSFIPGETK